MNRWSFSAPGLRPPATSGGERIYAIGDLHGRMDLFEDMLKQIEQDVSARQRSSTRIVLLGDVIDRGPHSRELLERIWRLQQHTNRLVYLLGNHEDLLLASAAGVRSAQRTWIHNGGGTTLRSYGLDAAELAQLPSAKAGQAIVQAVGPEVLRWLSTRPLSYRTGDYFFCHAGVRPGVGLRQQRREDLLWIRAQFLESRRSHGAVIIHGHTEVDQIAIEPNRINVDTAAYRTGRLSAIAVQGTSRWVFCASLPI